MYLNSEKVRGRLSAADASGGVSISLFTQDGNSRTLAANESLTITDISISTATAMNLNAGWGSLSGGQILVQVNFAANSPPFVWNLTTPAMGPVGKAPLVQASAAGQVYVFIVGYITK